MYLSIAKKLWEASLSSKTNELDEKHATIVNQAKNQKYHQLLNNYRNWGMQDDCGAPLQFNFYSLKSYGLYRYIKYIFGTLLSNIIHGPDQRSYFFDDISIIKLIKGYDILKKCPIHQSPGNNLAYFFSRRHSANIRWLRYIYFTSVIRNFFNNTSNNTFNLKTILDIGTYYGGFQYVMKKIFPQANFILVDFPHQLARSAIFLGESFPGSTMYAIYDQNTFRKYCSEIHTTTYDFLFVTVDYYHKFSEVFTGSDLRVDLLTNFYSLGEMSRKEFKSYLNSSIMLNSKYLYFCNRYDSSPFYEPTFSESYSILDYLLEGFNISINRSAGIHNYATPVRKLFGKTKARPISAGYFELVQENMN